MATQYARIVERKAVLRNLIGAAGRIAGIGYEDPAEVEEAINTQKIQQFTIANSESRLSSLLRGLLHDAVDVGLHRGEIAYLWPCLVRRLALGAKAAVLPGGYAAVPSDLNSELRQRRRPSDGHRRRLLPTGSRSTPEAPDLASWEHRCVDVQVGLP